MAPSPHIQFFQAMDIPLMTEWLYQDARDDFLPDPIRFRDLRNFAASYKRRVEKRVFNHPTPPFTSGQVLKSNLMLREAVYLHPIARIGYLHCLRHFAQRLAGRISPANYAYIPSGTWDGAAYPFPTEFTRERWMSMQNDIRRACLDDRNQALVVSDLSAYYPHIRLDHLEDLIVQCLADSRDAVDDAALELLLRFLKQHSTEGCGLPLNLDPSSFLGSIYMDRLDQKMRGRRFQYYRWVDDIQIVATNKQQAIVALQTLQSECESRMQFLNSSKTRIIDRGSDAYSSLLAVDDDVLIADLDSACAAGTEAQITPLIPRALQRLGHYATQRGERKFRAFTEKLLNLSRYGPIRTQLLNALEPLLLNRLDSEPDRARDWFRYLSRMGSAAAAESAVGFACNHPTSPFDTVRMESWRYLLSRDAPASPTMLERARELVHRPNSPMVNVFAILALGKHGTHADREDLLDRTLSAELPYVIQRAILLAGQSLPRAQRDRMFKRIVEDLPDHTELVMFISELEAPDYGESRVDSVVDFVPEERPVEKSPERGIGIVNGQVRHFRMARAAIDYE